jgi:hypothetical protein
LRQKLHRQDRADAKQNTDRFPRRTQFGSLPLARASAGETGYLGYLLRPAHAASRLTLVAALSCRSAGTERGSKLPTRCWRTKAKSAARAWAAESSERSWSRGAARQSTRTTQNLSGTERLRGNYTAGLN